ncbi:hypothetical protein [Alienimonas chondri]|uniref:Flagellar M-ring N-terminal domain-containing protein n=1 Tax=Alienimonas chondri TaxID=2681879 RepID=A0ABX1VG34_9PLAN|nr:hypothetical protein [Alienimonas chondri]NNJ26996.1 hypothetical protein [Alienimonas chondri]
MNSLSDSYEKAKAFVLDLPPSGRWTLIGVPLALMAGFALLMTGGVGSSDEAPVSWGKVFASNELRSAEQALIEAGLTDFRTHGQRIFVPAAEVDTYNAALMVDGHLPGDSLSEFERQFDKAGIFTSREQLAELRNIALRKEVRKTLVAVKDIEAADVLWSVKETGEWPRREKKTAATVSLMPKRSGGLSAERVASIRSAVAGMVPDLAEEDITVLDQSTGKAHAFQADGPLDDRTQQALAAHTRRYRDTISQALAYIPGALVNVSVDLDAIRREVERSQSVDNKQTVTVEVAESGRTRTSNQTRPQGEPGVASNQPASVTAPAGPLTQTQDEQTDSSLRVVPSWTTTERERRDPMPEAVRVAVSIPESYHEAIAAGRGLAPGEDDASKAAYVQAVDAIRLAEEEKVRERVTTLLPANSPQTAVHVTTVTPIEPNVPVVAVPWTNVLGDLASRWGSTAALCAVAIAGLFVLRRGMKLPEPAPPVELPRSADRPGIAGRIGPGGVAEEDDEEPQTPRDRVAALAAKDPEAVAAVVGSWLRDAA